MEFFVHINVTPSDEKSKKDVEKAVKEWLEPKLEQILRYLVKDGYITEGEAHIFKATYLIGIMQ
jgi:hypothetical protein